MPPDNYLENPADWTDGAPLTPEPAPVPPGFPDASTPSNGGQCFAGAPTPAPGLRPVGSEAPLQALPGVNFETGEGIAPEEPVKVPLAEGESVMSNRRFQNGALFNWAPANSKENPDMCVIFDANKTLVGFIRSESLAGFICMSCTEQANRVNEAFMKAQTSPILGKDGRPIQEIQ